MYCSYNMPYRDFKTYLTYPRKVDWDDVCEELGFSELHKVILGLRPGSLDAESSNHAQDLDEPDLLGRTALYHACSFGLEDYTGVLLSHGADPNVGAGPWLPLLAAIGSENRHCVKLLLEHDAKIPVQFFKDSGQFDDLGKYIEGFCEFAEADQMVNIDKLLFEHGFDFNFQNRDGFTVLMRCCEVVPPESRCCRYRNFRKERLELLLDNGVNVELEDHHGKTALAHAVMNANACVFRKFIHAGARLDTQAIGGLTILHLAVLYADNVGIVQALIDTSTSVIELEAQDTYGYSAFHLMRLRVGQNGYMEARPRAHYTCIWSLPPRDPHDPSEDRFIHIARTPEGETEIIAAFDVLFRKLQDERGVPAEARYPTSRSLTGQVGNEECESDGAFGEMKSIPGA